MELTTYYRETADYLVAVRAGGLALSAVDDDLVARWFDDGVPLALVLQCIDAEAKRQKGLKRPNRNLPLRLVGKQIKKSLKKRGLNGAANSQAGPGGSPEGPVGESAAPTPGPDTVPELVPVPEEAPEEALLSGIIERAETMLREGAQAPVMVLEPLKALRSQVREGLDEYRARARLIAIARQYLDHRVDRMEPTEREELEQAIREELGGGLRRMSARARQETVRELLRRKAAESDPLFPDAEVRP